MEVKSKWLIWKSFVRVPRLSEDECKGKPGDTKALPVVKIIPTD
jgi:hypothetical protein